jgi:cytidylate kinase
MGCRIGLVHTPRNLQSLVDEHVARWQMARVARGRPDRPAPCVALSRLPGAGGAELGQMVAERLGYGFFGIEIVDRIAREQNVPRELVAGVDEHVRSVIDRYVIDAMRRFTEDDYLRQVVRTVTTIAEQGGAVFLGRGSVFILRPERTLRVLVVAPREERLERAAKSHDLDLEHARAFLTQEEDTRRSFYRHHFRVDPDDPSAYDVIVNTGTLGMEPAVHLVVEALDAKLAAAVTSE